MRDVQYGVGGKDRKGKRRKGKHRKLEIYSTRKLRRK